jgi:hypothetical protein
MSNKKAASKKSYKKEARQKVHNKLVVALAEFKTGLRIKNLKRICGRQASCLP